MRDHDPGTITDRNVPYASSEWNRLRPREETMDEPTSSCAETQTKTRDTEPASVAAEPLARTRPAARRQEPEAAGQSIGRIADWPQPRPGWGTGEAKQEHSRTEKPEGARRRFRDIEKEQRTDVGLVTVVIPCYNQAHLLGETIESMLAQEKKAP